MGEEEGRRLPARSTRGKRLTKVVLEEELDADEAFWNQDAFKEDDADDGYKTEEEVADEFDSDFNDSEPGGDDEDGFDPDEETKRSKQKKSKLKINVLRKQMAGGKKKGILPKSEGGEAETWESGQNEKPAQMGQTILDAVNAAARENGSETDLAGDLCEEDLGNYRECLVKGKSDANACKDDKRGSGDGVGGVRAGEEKTIRKSKRTAVVVKAAERERERARAKVTAPVRKRKEAGTDDRKLTQEEMLHEAAQTEILNLQSLEIMLAREEEIKKKAIVQKETYVGPVVRFYSRGGVNVLEFMKVQSLPPEIHSKAPPYPKRSICIVTGLPAKYRDPKTGFPYATKEAFQLIRERADQGGGLSLVNEAGVGSAGGEGRRQAEGSREMPLAKRRVKGDRAEKQSSGKAKQSKGKVAHAKSSASGGDRLGPSSHSTRPLSSPIVPVQLEFRSSPSVSVPSYQLSSLEAAVAYGPPAGPLSGGKAGAEGAARVLHPQSQTEWCAQASSQRLYGPSGRRSSLDLPLQRSELCTGTVGDGAFSSDASFQLATPDPVAPLPGVQMMALDGEEALHHVNNVHGEGTRTRIGLSSLTRNFCTDNGGEGSVSVDGGMSAGRASGLVGHNILGVTLDDSGSIG